MIGEDVEIHRHDRRRDFDEFSESAVQKKQVFAEAELRSFAVEALLAWGRVVAGHSLADLESCAFSNCFDNAAEFVTEECWRFEHPGMTAPVKYFEVGTAGGGGRYPNEDFADPRVRHLYGFESHLFLSVKNGRLHRGFHGRRRIFMVRSSGFVAFSMARGI
jgi:hypothetical protein